MAKVSVPKPRYSNPAPGGGVARGVRTGQILGKSTESALNRRMKLDDALGKMKGSK